jgi:hypothetical protein
MRQTSTGGGATGWLTFNAPVAAVEVITSWDSSILLYNFR